MLGFAARRVPIEQRGTKRRADEPATAIVVGGGLAGTAAATVLAERGVSVTLLEREPFLGGRAGAWTDQLSNGEPFELERGFHAFFRQYYNLRNLLRRVDPHLRNLAPLLDYPIYGPHGSPESFTGVPRMPPFNLLGVVQRSPRLRWTDMPQINGPEALQMLAYDPVRTWRDYDGRNAQEYLDSLNFPAEARRLLFDVFAHSFFNPEEGMSAAEMLAMFHFYFTGNPEGLVFDVMNEPLSLAIWLPLRRYLEGLGVTIECGRAVRALTRTTDGRFQAEVADREEPAVGDVAVLAVEVPALKRLVDASEQLAPLQPIVAPLDVTLPFVVWRLWLERPPRADRAPFLAASGLGELDLVGFRELLDGESRRWAMRTGGSCVELHAYAAPEEMDEPALRADLLHYFYGLFPEAKDIEVLEERFLLRRDCPAFPPGTWAERPTVPTPIDGLALAGDFVRLPFPTALMERATAAGFTAANHVMDRWQLEPEPLWSVPPRGLTAALYR